MIRRTAARAFTLIELLVAISIILLMVGLAVPFLAAISDAAKVEAGVNTVSIAAEATRAYVEKERTYLTDPISRNAQFRGVAIIFAPSGEIRLTAHDPNARVEGGGPNDFLHLMTDGTDPAPRYGFKDIPARDYVDIPDGVVIHGIGRNQPTGPPQFLHPPFALRFDENGHLISRTAGSSTSDPTAEDRMVFYNGDHSGTVADQTYDVSDDRPGTWDPTGFQNWDPSAEYDNDPDWQRHFLPFERLETVIGVRVLDREWYDPAEPDFVSPDAPDDAYRYILFSRYTGAPMRNQ